MIELRDTVAIEAGPHEVWGWLESLPEHYRQWHPDHVSAWAMGGRVAGIARHRAEEGQNLRALLARRDR